MQSSQKTILAVVLAAVIFLVAGLSIGLALGAKSSSSPSVFQNGNGNANPLSSSIITSVFAFGQLASVSGSNITLTSGANSLTLSTDSKTKIVSYQQTKDAKGNPVNQSSNITLSDLKTGDYLNVNMKVLPSGLLNAVIINRVAVVAAGK